MISRGRRASKEITTILQMEKGSDHESCSKEPHLSYKKNTLQKQENLKSFCQRGHESYQLTLEKDIAKLQKQLKQEVDKHRTLERALTRSLGALPRFSPGLTVEVQKLVAEVAVLEEEVFHLEEYIRVLHKGLVHSKAFHDSILGQNSTLRSRWPAVADASPSNHARESNVTVDKRSPVIATVLPLVAESSPTSVSLSGTFNSGLPKSELSRSLSFRREVTATMPAHGICYT